jgi:hypothetical protein
MSSYTGKPNIDRKDTSLGQMLLAIGGKKINIADIEEDYDRILQDSITLNNPAIIMMPGEPSKCHRNSALCWEQNNHVTRIMTGYALLDNEWLQHTWLIHDNDSVIETTLKRECYVGFILTKAETEDFFNENCD